MIINSIFGIIVLLLFYTAFPASLAWLIVSIVRLIRARNKAPEIKKRRKVWLIVSSVLFGTVQLGYLSLIILFFEGLKHM